MECYISNVVTPL